MPPDNISCLLWVNGEERDRYKTRHARDDHARLVGVDLCTRLEEVGDELEVIQNFETTFSPPGTVRRGN
jgi:hypothetical protein